MGLAGGLAANGQIGGGGAGAITSVFGRTGVVTAASADYTAAQVTNAVDRTATGSQSMAGQLSWAAQATALVLGAQVAANPVFQNKLLAADANAAVQIRGDGQIQWGLGGASALDTTLKRSGIGILNVNGGFQVGTSGSSTTVIGEPSGSNQYALGQGVGPASQYGLQFGNGDAILYRAAAAQLITNSGVGFFSHAAPSSQPAAPVTLADVIAIIRGCGLSA